MLMSKLLGERLKEKPADASLISHIYLLRGGYIRQVSNGIYSLLLPAKRVAMKIEQIIREEMNREEGQEVLFPVVLPAELWEESGRFTSVGSELMRMKDRTGHDMLLGMTHEEAAVHLARSEANSYTDYPFMIYQIQTKFRDEPRSRGGLIRVREFTMKDAYSFHTTQEDLEVYYDKVLAAYHRIFNRSGVPSVISVGSDTGMMGGKVAHEFMLLTDAGEDTLVLCDHCGYKVNMEVAKSQVSTYSKEENPLEEVHTPGVTDIEGLSEFFKIGQEGFIKSTVFAVEGRHKPLIVFIRGDLQVNEIKLKQCVQANVFPLTQYEGVNLEFGYIGPLGLNGDEFDIVYDVSLKDEMSLVGGANKVDYHMKGIHIARDIAPATYVDVAKVNEGAQCIHCGSALRVSRGIEVGNIFQLGTKYTQTMNMTYADVDGKLKHPIMGCYGIGVGRLLACVIEDHHDDRGPIWPISVAPWQIHICILNKKNNPQLDLMSQEIYQRLSERYEVLMDDRDLQAGAQFADADLLGIPVRVIMSKRNLENGEVELVTRDKKTQKRVKLEELDEAIEGLIKELWCEMVIE